MRKSFAKSWCKKGLCSFCGYCGLDLQDFTHLYISSKEETLFCVITVIKRSISPKKRVVPSLEGKKGWVYNNDVITTGSTIGECGKVLLKAGANKVYTASVAIAD
jgi:phosphoribosylpyrophosphate synthetase